MARINITREHALPLTVLKDKINAIAIELDEQYQLKSEWEGNCLFFKRKGASGSIEVDQHQFELNLTLGRLFKVAKGEIEKKITAIIDTQLAG